ncbi:malonyl-coenzyme A:anthocyanin 3-O-glucoside-6''-O-malonyltransferase-like [Rutidosis leptorrhynchoides]|uniref:malonyl-coenzyme A:anthocyanin 3-O-glucoside-6''-O-malonyltransferase-like n=1 Tax=Rutidosis leptorrhynchoides TaxID=125765 RepID=UPI003A990C7E
MNATSDLTIIEQCRISPPPFTIGHRSMPLTFFDMTWLLFPPVHHTFFYDFPHSKSHFLETVVPNLKHSLSLTLQHFFPFVSNLFVFTVPDHSGLIKKPEIRHVEGDYVALTFAESSADFTDLTGNHPRKCEKFYPLVPHLGKAVKTSDYVSIPLFSVQVTFFPNSGISIGTTNHHSLADATTRFRFLKVWTSMAKFGEDRSDILTRAPPIYDRLIDIPKLDEKKLKETKLESFYQPPSLVGSGGDKVRATFVLARTNIDRLKKMVVTQLPEVEYVSSFTVTCSYIWSCIARSQAKICKDDLEQFIFTVDCRSRLDPPVPAAYSGNCGAPCIVTIKSVVLSGENGFLTAVKLFGEGITKMVNNKDGILKDAEKWHDGFKVPARKIGIAGTPKLDFYAMDFGWGKVKKYETISIDYNSSISITSGRESTQDVEIGLCFPSLQMKAFGKIFNVGLV